MNETTSNPTAAWSARAEAGHPLALRLLTWIALHLGRAFTRLLLHPITLYFVLVRRAERAASYAYLTRVLERTPRAWEVYKHFLWFSTVTLDRLYFVNDRFDLFDIRLYGAPELQTRLTAAAAPPRGFFLFGAHLGSFEAVRASRHFFGGVQVDMVMHEDNARKLHATLAALNPAVADSIIPLGRLDSMLRVSERLDDGDLIGILSDRAISPNAGKMKPMPFLGSPAPLPTGPLRMAAMLQRPVMFITGIYRGGKRYDIHFAPLADFSQTTPVERDAAVAQALAAYAGLLEQHCRATPFNWFNFYDFWHDTHI